MVQPFVMLLLYTQKLIEKHDRCKFKLPKTTAPARPPAIPHAAIRLHVMTRRQNTID